VSSAERVRIEVGFQGGQVIGSFVTTGSADQLEQALHHDGPRVVVLDTDEGPYHVVVPEVAYLRRFNRAGRVGFTAA
jgi:DNA-binding beta-propeller fold protein YncE